MHQNRLDFIVIDDGLEAIAVRAAADYWGVVTRMFFVGKASDLIGLLNGSTELAACVLLMCHGSEHGIVLPKLEPGIAKREPFDEFLSSEEIGSFVKLNGQIVLSSGCETGTKAFAKAFLSNGAKYYLAPQGYPEGDASLIYLLSLLYRLFISKAPIAKAHALSKHIDRETGCYQIFK